MTNYEYWAQLIGSSSKHHQKTTSLYSDIKLKVFFTFGTSFDKKYALLVPKLKFQWPYER